MLKLAKYYPVNFVPVFGISSLDSCFCPFLDAEYHIFNVL